VNDGHRLDPILSVIADALGLTAPTFHEADGEAARQACANAMRQLVLSCVKWVCERLNDPCSRFMWNAVSGIAGTMQRWAFLESDARLCCLSCLCSIAAVKSALPIPKDIEQSLGDLLSIELRLSRTLSGDDLSDEQRCLVVGGMVAAILLRASRSDDGAVLVGTAWDRACYAYERTLEAVQRAAEELEEPVTEVA
jgi:hypothetical protein